MAVTLKQLSEHTHLSIPTISEILNNKNRLYKNETKRRVFEAARQLGYRPNGSARSIKSGRFRTIALLQSCQGFRTSLPSTLLSSIEVELKKHGLLLLMESVADEELEPPNSIPGLLKTWSADGLLINYISGYPEPLREFIYQQHFPAVWINSKHENDCVYPNDGAGAIAATEYLIDLGHRRIAFIDYNFGWESDPVHYSSIDRHAGYHKAMTKAGLTPMKIQGEQQIPTAERIEYSLKWLSQPSRPTAVVCYAPETTLPVYVAARSLGLSIPREISIMGFDDNIIEAIGARIDTVILPGLEMGTFAVEHLLRKIQDPSYIFSGQALSLRLEKGWTTAPPCDR
jgi:LacI family transcriptional regulator